MMSPSQGTVKRCARKAESRQPTGALYTFTTCSQFATAAAVAPAVAAGLPSTTAGFQSVAVSLLLLILLLLRASCSSANLCCRMLLASRSAANLCCRMMLASRSSANFCRMLWAARGATVRTSCSSCRTSLLGFCPELSAAAADELGAFPDAPAVKGVLSLVVCDLLLAPVVWVAERRWCHRSDAG